jgi:hypothetical protein
LESSQEAMQKAMELVNKEKSYSTEYSKLANNYKNQRNAWLAGLSVPAVGNTVNDAFNVADNPSARNWGNLGMSIIGDVALSRGFKKGYTKENNFSLPKSNTEKLITNTPETETPKSTTTTETTKPKNFI